MPHIALSVVDKHIGLRLRGRRLETDMSQTDLAEQLGISFQQIQKYELGRNRLSASALHQLALILDVTPAYFFEGLQERPDGGAEIDLAVRFAAGEGAELARAFLMIQSPRTRRAVLNLVVSLAERERDEAEPELAKSA